MGDWSEGPTIELKLVAPPWRPRHESNLLTRLRRPVL
jgi:hypothetical protein